MSPIVAALVLFYVVSLVVSFADAIGYRLAKEIEERGLGFGCAAAIIAIPTGLIVALLAAWADMALWNVAAPQFGLPEIDLLTSLALGWLIGSLFRGMTPQRVRIHGNLTPKDG